MVDHSHLILTYKYLDFFSSKTLTKTDPHLLFFVAKILQLICHLIFLTYNYKIVFCFYIKNYYRKNTKTKKKCVIL